MVLTAVNHCGYDTCQSLWLWQVSFTVVLTAVNHLVRTGVTHCGYDMCQSLWFWQLSIILVMTHVNQCGSHRCQSLWFWELSIAVVMTGANIWLWQLSMIMVLTAVIHLVSIGVNHCGSDRLWQMPLTVVLTGTGVNHCGCDSCQSVRWGSDNCHSLFKFWQPSVAVQVLTTVNHFTLYEVILTNLSQMWLILDWPKSWVTRQLRGTKLTTEGDELRATRS